MAKGKHAVGTTEALSNESGFDAGAYSELMKGLRVHLHHQAREVIFEA